MLNGLGAGLQGLLSSISAISKYGLWLYIFLTAVISLLVAGICSFLIWNNTAFIGDWISGFYTWEKGSGLVEKVAEWFAWGATMILFLISYKYIMLILAAPILSLMSEKIENYHSSKPTQSFSVSHTIKSMGRGLRLSLGNITKELILTAILFILSFIPGLAIITAPLIFLVQAYYAGFGNMDYYMERHFNVSQSKKFVKQHRGLAIVNGTFYVLLLAIPFIGFLIGPIFSAIGASLAVDKLLEGK